MIENVIAVKNLKEIDNTLFSRLLNNDCLLVHGDCCKIIALINSNIEFLKIFTGFLDLEKPKYDYDNIENTGFIRHTATI